MADLNGSISGGTLTGSTTKAPTGYTDSAFYKGDKGDKGDKPVKGVDYWTEEDIEEITSEVIELDTTNHAIILKGAD